MTLVGVPLGDPFPANGMPAPDGERRVDVGNDDYAKQRCHEAVERAATLLQAFAELSAKASPH